MTSIQEVLLIDDFRSENNINKVIISQFFNVRKFTPVLSAEEAIKYLISLQEKKQPFPEFIFIDINLPVHNGWEFISWFNFFTETERSKTKLIVLSGSKLLAQKPDNIDPLSIYATIEKPLTAEKLVDL